MTVPDHNPPEPADDLDRPPPPPTWLRKSLMVLAALFFVFLVVVMAWGILDDLMGGRDY